MTPTPLRADARPSQQAPDSTAASGRSDAGIVIAFIISAAALAAKGMPVTDVLALLAGAGVTAVTTVRLKSGRLLGRRGQAIRAALTATPQD
ncbi:hypothetical protein OG239_00605 [Streptomyces sp. NBC_00868]|uniref:hypothetical protein n=1 Tax=unclassified Streptomyces TaxID=2593676 RepID=UPI00324B9A0C|nr:hypothetical protein OG239_00605 [Streptomyces sp. NBC_00868]